MINLILFGLGIGIFCGVGMMFALNKERAEHRRREQK